MILISIARIAPWVLRDVCMRIAHYECAHSNEFSVAYFLKRGNAISELEDSWYNNYVI